METVAAMDDGWTPRRQHRNGGFWMRAEIETDRGSPIPRGPGFGFAAAVREPLVKLRQPQYDFERWDWDYFDWPHDRLDANLEMRDSDPEATLEADLKASESFLNQRTLQLESYEMSQKHAAAWSCHHLTDNLEMRDGDLDATLEADKKASGSFLNQSTPQPESSLVCQHMPEQHAAGWPRDHLDGAANVGVRNSDNEAKLGTGRKTREQRSTRPLKRPEMDGKRPEMDGRTTAKEHDEEKENEQAQLLRTPMPVYKKAVGPRSARRRRVFAEANRTMDG